MSDHLEKKIYFASDFHLGAPGKYPSIEREKKVVTWLEQIRHDAGEIFLMGDLFDFWFEYKTAIPKGFTRLLGKLASLSDQGIRINIFTGNHDIWMRDYFETEIHANIYHEPQVRKFNGRIFYLHHGDGLGPGDQGYKMLKRIFTNPFCQWLFRKLHPDMGIRLAGFFSKKSRNGVNHLEERFLGEDRECLVIHSKEVLQHRPVNYFIYGHRHAPVKHQLSEEVLYVNLGDWINNFSYAVFDGNQLELKYYGS